MGQRNTRIEASDRRLGEAARRTLWMVLGGVILVAGLATAWAHGNDDRPTDNYQSGQVTGMSDRSVSINGHDYALHPKVVIQDDEGRSKQIQDFKTGTYVRYQLRDDRVRQLILVTPK